MALLVLGCASSVGRHRDIGAAGGADPAARVRAADSIRVDANLHDVWNLLIRVEDWAVWNRDIRSAEAREPLGMGTRFAWRAGFVGFEAEVVRCLPQESLVWAGTWLHLRSIHAWRLVERGGVTSVTVEASLVGAGAAWLYGRESLGQDLRNWLVALQRQAESRPPDREVGWGPPGTGAGEEMSPVHMVY